jgi:hypothetical protein
MDQNQDFTALRNLLALKRFDMPKDTQIDQFLTEFHTRQRAQLLARPSLWTQVTEWAKEKIVGFELVPSLSYGAAFAAIAITAFVGLSQQVQVTEPGHPFQLSLRMNPHENNSFAIIPASFGSSTSMSSKASDNLNFTPTRPSDSATTRFVLANNSHGVHDTSVTF